MVLKSPVTQMKNSLEGLNSRFELAEERINKLNNKGQLGLPSLRSKNKKNKQSQVSEGYHQAQ